MRKIILAIAMSASLVSVTACDSSTLGTLGGAGAGGLLGSQIGGGKGRLAATAAGTLLGAFLGNRAVAALSDEDTDYASQAEQRAYGAPVGQQVQWENPQSGNYGTITPIREGRNAQTGQYCREFQQSIYVNGRPEQGTGRACQQQDGSWQIVG